MNRVADRVPALVLAVVTAACLGRVYPLIDIVAERGSYGLDAATLKLGAYSAGALVCFIGALLFLSGQLPGRPAHAAGVPLFGRDAEVEPVGRPRLRRAFLVLPVVVLLALLGDRLSTWRSHEGGQDVASAPPAEPAPRPEPPAQAPPQAAKPPAPPPAAPETPSP
ncbi:WD40 repeat domain-containing protein, partial [Mesorhizobium sp. B2-3-4]